LAYVGLSDPFLAVAFWVGFVSAVLVVLSTLSILVRRTCLLWKRERREQFIELWRPVIVRWLTGEEAQPLPALPRSRRIDFLLLWMHYHENLAGDATEALNRLAEKLGVSGFLLKLLRHGEPDEKLVAAAACGHLRFADSTKILWHYAREPVSGLSLSAVRSLCQIHGARVGKRVLPLMLEHRDWPLAKIGAILNETGRDLIHRYIKAIESTYEHDREKLPRLLRVLAGVSLDHPLKLVRRILENDESPDLTAAALRLVFHPDELPLVRAHLRDPHWSVRVQAVARLAELGESQDIDAVVELLHDPEWWVRYRAAQTLLQLPVLTDARIRTLFQELRDPYARDVLVQAIAEAGENIMAVRSVAPESPGVSTVDPVPIRRPMAEKFPQRPKRSAIPY
jgi:hypothetical protein